MDACSAHPLREDLLRPPVEDPAAAAMAAVRAGRLSQAHRLLLQAVERLPDAPQLWFLLAWTAPSPDQAHRCFEAMRRLDPQNPLALDGLMWSEQAIATPSPAAAAPGDGDRPGAGLAPEAALVATKPLPPYEAVTIAPGMRARLVTQPVGALDTTGGRSLISNRAAVVAFAYLAGVAVAELVVTYLSPQLGLALHGLLLVLIFLHASLGAQGNARKLLYTLALAPLIRLLSLSMPLLQFQFTYWYLIIGAPLLIGAVLVLRLTGYSAASVGLGWGRRLPWQMAVGFSGLSLGFVEYYILRPQPLAQALSFQQVWLPALILLVFTGFLEELIFRGLMQRAAIAVLNRAGLLYVSLLFAALHIGYRSLLDIAFVFCVGLYFSVAVERTRSLFGVTLAHGLTNVALFLVFPFLR